MKIPDSFYFSFRWKNSLWAFASGMLLGYVVLSMFAKALERYITNGGYALSFLLVFGMGTAIAYQFVAQTYFYGKRRGEFEFDYLEDILMKRIKKIIKSVPCKQADRDLLPFDPTALNPTILQLTEKAYDPDLKFLLFMTLAMQCIKADEYGKIAEYAQEALAYKPDDLVANFILAEAQEYQGEGNKAVQSYSAALRDPMAESPPLRDFIAAQIARVQKNGPRTGSKIQKGLRYMTY